MNGLLIFKSFFWVNIVSPNLIDTSYSIDPRKINNITLQFVVIWKKKRFSILKKKQIIIFLFLVNKINVTRVRKHTLPPKSKMVGCEIRFFFCILEHMSDSKNKKYPPKSQKLNKTLLYLVFTININNSLFLTNHVIKRRINRTIQCNI
jgi:hypothetical protein